MPHATHDNAFLDSLIQPTDGLVTPRPSGHASLLNRKVLVVDDNPINLEIVVEALHDAGALVTEASNGQDALDHIARTTFDLVVLDLTMPDIDGFDVGRGIRSSANNATVPLLIFTASDAADARAAMRDLNAQDIVAKPMDIADLLSKADKHLQPQ